MAKAMDLLMWNLEVADREKVLPVIFELADKVQSEHGIRVRHMRRRQLRKDMDTFAEIYNSAWSRTGTSCRTPRRTSTPTPRSSSSASTSTGASSPRKKTPARSSAWR